MNINKEYIKRFNPCSDRWINFLRHYSDFDGSLVEFLELEKVSWSDKRWLLFHNDQKMLPDELMREFALICACIAVEQTDKQEIKDYYDLVLHIGMSGERSAACSAADSAAYYAADSAAYYAADSAADSAAEKDQCDILCNLIEEYEV